MHTELITIKTDTLSLEGVFYTPEGPIKNAIIYFHGNTMNFYTGGARFLPPTLTQSGYAFLAFNRRGHDVLSTRNSRIAEGGAFQTVAESLSDHEYAAKWLAEKGFENPIVMGHSYGGMLATRFVADHPNTPALVLLSAGKGGRDQDQVPGTEKLFSMDKGPELIKQANELVALGKPKDLMLMPGWWYVISAESYLDRLQNVPDTIALAAKIHCPVLAIRGDMEDVHRYPAEDFAKACAGNCDVEIIENCDHFYNQQEDVVANLIDQWLQNQLK
ncbi:alpha/beta hydrolase [Polynucleobacter rarus]|uniref:alpha/beta hydrolase n=1 Tax=Polynucleobacter rarus TaxID=556055 RepID=UPI000D3E0884|nr:alpha/beta hydrolase [Polynucleobacter rarus]